MQSMTRFFLGFWRRLARAHASYWVAGRGWAPSKGAGWQRCLLLPAMVCLSGVASGAEAGGSRWGRDYLPNVTVYNQHGKAMRFYDDVIKDRIVVISFIYTSCKNICPLVTARLAQVAESLGEAAHRDIRFVSISIDPIPDTPEKLKEMADAFHAPDEWLFLTGGVDDIALIRHKLGERSREINEHRNEILLGNDRTGEWARDSAFADLGVLTETIRAMDPEWRSKARAIEGAGSGMAIVAGAEQPGQALFIKTCGACHTVGKGIRVGPDLAGLTERRDRDWILRFITSPGRLRREHDPVALALADAFPGVRMPDLDLAESDAADVLAYIEHLDRIRAAEHASAGPAETPRQ